MKVEFLDNFYKDLDKIKVKKVKEDVKRIINNSIIAISINDIANVKKMKNAKNIYRIRIGDYRIGIYYENNIVEFACIKHRKDIYKNFP